MAYIGKALLESRTAEFLHASEALNFFPHGDGNCPDCGLRIDNAAVSLSSFAKEGDGYVLRLVNNGMDRQTATLFRSDVPIGRLSFAPYEAKMFCLNGNFMIEKETWY